MESESNKFLKAGGFIALITGLILVFVGFYFMANAMSVDNITREVWEASQKQRKLVKLCGIYMMIYGGLFCYSGFIGVVNCAATEEFKKCVNLGWLMIGIGFVNAVLVIILSGEFTKTSLIITVFSLIIAVIYLIGAFQNKKRFLESEKNND